MSFEYFEAENHVKTYSQFRPCPPKELIDRIVSYASEKLSKLEFALDVGCGSGQSTQILSPYFKKVLGVDPSEHIIAEARRKNEKDNVSYSTSPAESIKGEDGSVTVITVGQAIQWFDTEQFYKQANRLLCKDGVLAVYGYHLPVPIIGGEKEKFGELVEKYYANILADYVFPESLKVYIENYRAKEFNEVPFVQNQKMLREDNFCTEMDTTLEGVVGYIASWSAFQNYQKQAGEKQAETLLKNFEEEFKSLVKPTELLLKPFKVKFKYFLLLGRKH